MENFDSDELTRRLAENDRYRVAVKKAVSSEETGTVALGAYLLEAAAGHHKIMKEVESTLTVTYLQDGKEQQLIHTK